jgi:hypothetical protein
MSEPPCSDFPFEWPVPRCGSQVSLSLVMSSEPCGVSTVFCQRLCNEDANDAVEIGCHLEVSPVFFSSLPQGGVATTARGLGGKTEKIRLRRGSFIRGWRLLGTDV